LLRRAKELDLRISMSMRRRASRTTLRRTSKNTLKSVSSSLVSFFLPSFPLAHFAGSDGLSFVEQSRAAGKIVLIHCTAGKSRSPTIAMAYLIQQNGYFIVFLFLSQSSAHYISSRWSLRKSYDFLKRQRDISPNLGFLCSLGEFEKGFFPCFLFLSFFFPPSSQSQHEIASFVQNRNSRRQE